MPTPIIGTVSLAQGAAIQKLTEEGWDPIPPREKIGTDGNPFLMKKGNDYIFVYPDGSNHPTTPDVIQNY